MKKIIFALALALALVGFAPVAQATDADTLTCEGTPEVLGYEWQLETRTREVIPEVAEVSHEVYSYKQKVELTKTEHKYKKEVRTTKTHKTGHPKDQLVHDWQWWSPASIKWEGPNFTETGLHGQWNDNPWKYTRVYRYTATGDTRQVPDGFEWQYSGEVTEPLDAPWVLLDGYPKTIVTQEYVPASLTDWSDWAADGDVVRTDEQVEPELPENTETAEYRWAYIGTYVRENAVPPLWQDTNPDGDCYNGPTPTPTPEPTPDPTPTPTPDPTPEPTPTPEPDPAPEVYKDVSEFANCDGVFRRVQLWEIPADGSEPILLETLEDKVRDLTEKEAIDLGCIELPPPPAEDELAETGDGSGWLAFLAVGLMGAGAWLVWLGTRRSA